MGPRFREDDMGEVTQPAPKPADKAVFAGVPGLRLRHLSRISSP
jgi:hypothetical protein